ncbi:MAG: NAD(P)-dependent oxidoreductase [Chthoniobacteraceae bacterium]
MFDRRREKDMNKPTIGFVGVGRMGANIARHLHELGYPITTLFDSYKSAAELLAAEIGSQTAKNLPEVTAAADVIFTVVTNDAAMESLFSGPDSLLHGASGKVFINCATVSPQAHEAAAAAASSAGAATLAACMASSITQAREGTLYLMVGGDAEVFTIWEPLLRDLSSSLRYVGSVGDAAKIKALVNMVMNINTAGLAEGLGLGIALGLDPDVLKEVFSQTGANSQVLATDGDDMIAREHVCFFSAAHAAKDSGIANTLADEAHINVPLSKATQAQYQRLIDLGNGELDKSAIAELTFPGRAG